MFVMWYYKYQTLFIVHQHALHALAIPSICPSSAGTFSKWMDLLSHFWVVW